MSSEAPYNLRRSQTAAVRWPFTRECSIGAPDGDAVHHPLPSCVGGLCTAGSGIMPSRRRTRIMKEMRINRFTLAVVAAVSSLTALVLPIAGGRAHPRTVAAKSAVRRFSICPT